MMRIKDYEELTRAAGKGKKALVEERQREE